MFQFFNLCSEDPRQLIFHIAPQALDRIEFGTIGQQEQTHDIIWHQQRFRFMTAPVIHEHDIQRILIVVRKLIQKDLKIDGVQLR
jgi:hypothetical protein